MTVTFQLFIQFLINIFKAPVKFERYMFRRIRTSIKFIDYTQKNHFHTPNVTQFYVYISSHKNGSKKKNISSSPT